MRYLRIKKKKEFLTVLKKGKRCRAETLTAVLLPSEQTKMAVCVGKKYGKSVQRNRIKRLLRAAFAVYAGELLSPRSFLLIPKQAEEYSFSSFSRDLNRILVREHLLEH